MSKILALTGGVGGAKLALGLSRVLPPDELMFAVNTGDDFEHLGLHISPDLDSLTYALSQQNNTETGWGRLAKVGILSKLWAPSAARPGFAWATRISHSILRAHKC